MSIRDWFSHPMWSDDPTRHRTHSRLSQNEEISMSVSMGSDDYSNYANDDVPNVHTPTIPHHPYVSLSAIPDDILHVGPLGRFDSDLVSTWSKMNEIARLTNNDLNDVTKTMQRLHEDTCLAFSQVVNSFHTMITATGSATTTKDKFKMAEKKIIEEKKKKDAEELLVFIDI